MKQFAITEQHAQILHHFGLVEDRAVLLRFSAGEYLLRQGYPISHFLILLEGGVDVRNYDSEGRQILLGLPMSTEQRAESTDFGPAPLGDQELLLSRNTALNTVIAKSPSLCLALPWENAAAQLAQSVRFSNLMARAAVKKLTDLQRNYRTVALKSGEARFCGYLLQNAQHGVFRETLTFTAPVLGISYRQLQRIVQSLCARGLLQKQQEGYRLTDPAALQRLAQR